MSKVPVQLMIKSPPVIDFTGEPTKSAGFYGPTVGLITIAIQTLNFQGKLYIEGSCVVSPTDSDWFPIQLLSGQDYLLYPFPSNMRIAGPLYGLDIDWYSLVGINGESSTRGYNINCNCLWMRARIERSYFLPGTMTESQIAPFGLIDSILVSF